MNGIRIGTEISTTSFKQFLSSHSVTDLTIGIDSSMSSVLNLFKNLSRLDTLLTVRAGINGLIVCIDLTVVSDPNSFKNLLILETFETLLTFCADIHGSTT